MADQEIIRECNEFKDKQISHEVNEPNCLFGSLGENAPPRAGGGIRFIAGSLRTVTLFGSLPRLLIRVLVPCGFRRSAVPLPAKHFGKAMGDEGGWGLF